MLKTGKSIRYSVSAALAAAILSGAGGTAYAQEAETAPPAEAAATEETPTETTPPPVVPAIPPTDETAADPATSAPAADAPPVAETAEETVLTPPEPPQPVWTVGHAEQLLTAINGIGAEGLKPADYAPEKLAAAMFAGEGEMLDAEFTRAFTWLAEDLRDGRTPMKSRVQWFVVDPDAEMMPTAMLLTKAKESGDIAATLKSLEPKHADYAALRDTLAATPEDQVRKRQLIMANMDRWRWLKRDLGKDYLFTNVPEYMLRFVYNNKQITTYKTVVGKPGRTATPQLAETVEGIIFNPTWTVPQSIVKGEGLGARVLANPAWARAKGYKATKHSNGWTSVVQKPGPTNSLGYMKLDMPNPHAIFLHDTPSRHLFRNANRALSHGCIRTENAMALAMTIALVQGDVPISRTKNIVKSLKYTRVPVKRELPVYITYFTMGTDISGDMKSYRDVYGRDKPVFRALAAARPNRGGKRMMSSEKVVAIEAPGA